MKVGLGLRSMSGTAAEDGGRDDGETGTASIPWNLAQKFNLAEAKEQFFMWQQQQPPRRYLIHSLQSVA